MPTLLVDPITDKTVETDEIVVGDIQVDDVILDIANVAATKDNQSIREILIDGLLERTMEGASNLTFTVHDPLGKLLNSGVLDSAIDIYVDGLWWRLVAVNKNDSELDLVFEDRDVAIIRGHDKVVKTSRKGSTRAEFCVMLIRRSPKLRHLRIVCPELHKTEKIHSGKKEKKDIKDRKRELGIVDTGDLKVWYARGDWRPPMALSQMFTTRPATNAQIDIAEQILDEAYKHHPKATEKVQIAAVAVGMVESSLQNLDGGDRDSVGVFQQRPSQGWTGLKDVSKAAKEFLDVAVKINKDNPGLTIESVASRTQMGGHEVEEYMRKVKSAARLAKDFVDAYGGADLNSPVLSYRKRYMFSTENGGTKEDWWTAIGRLMTDVGWARFMSNGVLYLIAETSLLKSKIRMKFSEQTPGIQRINFNYDVGQTIANATVTCRSDRWVAPPGTVVMLENCGPADGRWLVSTIRRSLYNRNATIELKKPTKRLGEPASEIVLRDNADTTVSTHHSLSGSDKQGSNWHPPLALTGKITYAPGSMNPNTHLVPDLVKFLELVAGKTQERIQVNTGTHHSYLTTSGSVSNHVRGAAADLDVGYFGGPPTPAAALAKGTNILIAAYRVCGMSYREAKKAAAGGSNFSVNQTWRGHSVEFGWQTMVGGNHYNHVHIGFDS